MSMLSQMVVGYFDARAVLERGGPIVPARPLTADDVERLQAVCDELFGTRSRLEEDREDGLLRILNLGVSPEMYQVACVAQELFGMSSVDVMHGTLVYPEPEWEVPTREAELARKRKASILRGAELERDVDEWLDFLTRANAARRQIHERVRAYAAGRGSA
jgi:hypothetical protein